MKIREIVSKSGKVIEPLDRVDKNLPKYSRFREEKKKENGVTVFNNTTWDPDNSYVMGENDGPEKMRSPIVKYTSEELRRFVKNEDSKNFNILLTETLRNNYTGEGDRFVIQRFVNSMDSSDGKKKDSGGIFKKISSWFSKKKKEAVSISIFDLFEEVKLVSGKGRDFVERIEEYVELIDKAKRLGQKAHEEVLADRLIIHIYESILSCSDLNRYIELTDLGKLQEKCTRLLDLDYIKNFNRVIPDSVAKKKLWADELDVFDNYVILHYDPSGEAVKETKEEIKAKKDPILFGIIKGSNRLYYIDSWIDDYCDLTWDVVLEKIGEKKL